MVVIKVRYDGYNRQFKLVDRELAHALKDGEIYIVVADVAAGDVEQIQQTVVLSEPVIVTA